MKKAHESNKTAVIRLQWLPESYADFQAAYARLKMSRAAALDAAFRMFVQVANADPDQPAEVITRRIDGRYRPFNDRGHASDG